MPTIEVYENPDTLAVAAGELFITLGREAIATRGAYDVLLSGGSTPRAIYTWIGQQKDALDWSKVRLFFGDERCVSPDHADSNYRMTRETMLDALADSGLTVYRIEAERDPAEAAAAYDATLRDIFGTSPAFDLVYLGIGADSHTASLFPHTPALQEKSAWFVANYAPAQQAWRITGTAPLLNTGHVTAFVISGKGKAEAVNSILNGPRDTDTYPAQLIQPTSDDVRWLLDREAASVVKG